MKNQLKLMKQYNVIKWSCIKFQIIKTVWFANNPEKETLPSTTASGEGLSSMQKLLLFITIRPDKVIPAVRYDFYIVAC